MNRFTCLTLIIALVMLQGCASTPPASPAHTPTAATSGESGRNRLGDDAMKLTPVAHVTEAPVETPIAHLTEAPVETPIAHLTEAPVETPMAHVTEVPVEKNAPAMPGHPLTSVVVTQCNLIVAVYMTMPDGRLLRFDRSASIPSEQLMTMAYSATRSERVEVSCNQAGVEGYEKHEPV